MESHNQPAALNSARLLLVTICAYMLAANLLAFVGCKRSHTFSSWESELAPIASILSFVQEADLKEAGVIPPDNYSRFEITPEQAELILGRIKARVKLGDVPPDLSTLRTYRFFLKKVDDPVVERARIKLGQSRPYTATVYAVGEDGRFDRDRDPFFVD